MWRDAGHMYLPAPEVDEEEDVVGHEPTQRPDFGSEEVGRHEDVHVYANELLPCRGRLPLWCWRDAMALEDVAHRLRTDGQVQVGQGADDPVIAPRAILLGYADNQCFELLVDCGTTWGLPLRGAVEFLGDQC